MRIRIEYKRGYDRESIQLDADFVPRAGEWIEVDENGEGGEVRSVLYAIEQGKLIAIVRLGTL